MSNVGQRYGRILVLVDKERRGGAASITFELLGVGEKIANSLNGTLCAAVLGYKNAVATQEIVQFADEIYSIDHTLLARFQAELYANALDQLCRNIHPDIVLMGNTLDNLDLTPRLACKMRLQVVTDCINLTIEPVTGHLLCNKPVYGGNAIATFKLEKKPYIATLRPKVMEPIGPGPFRGEITHFYPVLDESSVKVESIGVIKEENISLDKADAIIAGGRGVKNVEGLKQFEEIIKVLRRHFGRVELGASRPLIDAGFVPSSRQIGLTGEKVAPKLYIAVGISGSVQHLTGILGSKKIIAINSDPKAPIFGVANYGVIGKYEDVLPALKKKLEELL